MLELVTKVLKLICSIFALVAFVAAVWTYYKGNIAVATWLAVLAVYLNQ